MEGGGGEGENEREIDLSCTHTDIYRMLMRCFMVDWCFY